MTPVSRLSEIRMSTVVSLETLKFKAVMNKQRMNATELLLYLWLGLSLDTIRGTQRQFSENICSEDDLRSRIFGTFFVKFLTCLPHLGFSNI